MSQPGREDGGLPAREEPLSQFLEGLQDRFAAYRPQGSPSWNFADAFRRLEAAWGPPAPPGPLEPPATAEELEQVPPQPAAAVPDPVAKGLARRVADRLFLDRLRLWIDYRVTSVATETARGQATEAAARATDEALGKLQHGLDAGFDATIEALRFLAARVEPLESAAALRRHPVTGEAWLEADDTAHLLAGPVTAALAGVSGPVLHAECGSGALLAALSEAGIDARGVDPRGRLALAAADRGLRVELGNAADAIDALAPGEVAALVLAGIVDRAPLEDLCGLLASATTRLSEGSQLVVVSAGEGSVAGWAAVARDLLPGRPLHPETWELLLVREGYTDVRRLTDNGGERGGHPGSAYAVAARAPG